MENKVDRVVGNIKFSYIYYVTYRQVDYVICSKSDQHVTTQCLAHNRRWEMPCPYSLLPRSWHEIDIGPAVPKCRTVHFCVLFSAVTYEKVVEGT